MSFDVDAGAYARFMGRFSEPLAAEFVAQMALSRGLHALDVGCGPGALTSRLIEHCGPTQVAAVDPSESFVAAAHARFPDIDVRRATAERLPFGDETFDVSAAQLVVHFMTDPVAGLSEMARVTRRGGQVAACVWDHGGGRGPLSTFWRAVADIDPLDRGEADLAGAREGHLTELFDRAGIVDIASPVLAVDVGFRSFSDWWEPYTLGVGPAGAYVARLGPEQRAELASRCADLLPTGPFTITASAWSAIGRVAG